MTCRTALLLVLIFTAAQSSPAQELFRTTFDKPATTFFSVNQQEHSSEHSQLNFDTRINPTLQISLWGSSGIAFEFKHKIQEERNWHMPNFANRFDDYVQYVPAIAVFGLNSAGYKGKSSFKRNLLNYALSMVIMAATTHGLKSITKIERPDHSGFNSFPSGHTATAFFKCCLFM